MLRDGKKREGCRNDRGVSQTLKNKEKRTKRKTKKRLRKYDVIFEATVFNVGQV